MELSGFIEWSGSETQGHSSAKGGREQRLQLLKEKGRCIKEEEKKINGDW